MGKPANKIRDYLREEIRKRGGIIRNYVSPGHVGVADTLILLPPGRIIFCEIKAPGDTERPWQERERQRMHNLGFEVCVVYAEMGVNMLLDALDSRIENEEFNK